MSQPYEAYKVNTLVNQYRANPDMFNDDQLDELEKLAEQNNISFKRNTSPFSMRRAMQQASAGFIEGFTTFDLMPKEPRNTGEAIFRQLGHLAGFAPSILKAPVVGLAKVVASATGRKTKDVLKHRVTSSVMNAIDFIGPKSIPMIAQHKVQDLYNRGIKRTGMDTLDFMKRGAKTRAIAEEAVGLAGASAVSSIWKGGDAIIDSFIGGAVAGGAFGGIGNFANVARFHKGSPEQIEKANKILRTSLGAMTTGLPATLRGEPTEMQIYEYLLGGFFGYNTRPAKERNAHTWLTNEERFSNRDGGAEILDPRRSKDFKEMSKEAQDYLLYEHPMPQDSGQFPNSRKIGGTTGQALGYLEKHFPQVDFTKWGTDTLGSKFTEKGLRNWYGQKASDIYRSIKIQQSSPKPAKESKKTTQSMDFNDPVEIQDVKIAEISKELFPTAKETFKTEGDLAEKISDIRIKTKDTGVESFITSIESTLGKPLTKQQSSGLRKFYNQEIQEVHDVWYTTFTPIWERGEIVDYVATSRRGKNEFIDDNVSIGEKYGELPINKLAGGGFELMTHQVSQGKANKILTSYPDYNTNRIEFFMDSLMENAMHVELYRNHGRYVFSGIKDKNALMTAPIKTKVSGVEVTPKEIMDVMQNGLNPAFKPHEVRARLEEAYQIAKNKSRYTEEMFNDIWVSNILHHAEMNGLLGKTGNKVEDIRGLTKMLQGKYLTSPSDFNKRMQLMGNRMTPLDPNSFADILPDGNLNVVFIKDTDLLRHMYKPDKDGRYPNESNTDGGIFYRQGITERVLDSLGLPDAGHFKPVMVGKGEGGLFATKSNGQMASPAWEAFMRANNIDGVVLGSSSKLRGEYQDTPIEYNKSNNSYNSNNIRTYKIPIKDMEVSLGTYENMYKAVRGQELPLQIFNTYDIGHKGFAESYGKMVENIHKGSENARGVIEGSTNKNGDIDISKFKNQMEVADVNIKELPVDFVMKHLLSSKGNKEVAAYLMDKIQKLDKIGGLDVDTFQADIDFEYTRYNEMMDRITHASQGTYNSRLLLFKDHQTNFLKKFIISQYANPFVETGGKAWLKAISPDMLQTMEVGPNNKRRIIKEGHVYLDNAFKQMPVVLGNKRYNLKQVWDFYVGAQPIPKGISKKAVKDALELVVIRTPSDSPSGSRVLVLGGWTNQKGAGAFTHHKDDFYLGGADKDSDSIKIFQGFSRKLKDSIKKQANEKESYRDPNSKEYNSEYAKALSEPFQSKTLDANEKFRISGKGEIKSPLDKVIPKMLSMSPEYRLDVAKRAKAGLDGLGNGLSASVYLKNVMDYVKEKGLFDKSTGEIKSYETPYGRLEIDIKNTPVAGKDRMQFFRDTTANIVNKSADASSDPTVKNYSYFRDMLLNSILDVNLVTKDGRTPITSYKRFTALVESSPDLKPVVRAIHQVKTNNSFRMLNSDLYNSLASTGKIQLQGRSWILSKDAFEALNLHAGERLLIDPKEELGLGYMGSNYKQKDGTYRLRAEFIPNRPELTDLEADIMYIGQKLSHGKAGSSYVQQAVMKMAEQFGVLGKGYTDRLAESYSSLFKYLDTDLKSKIKGVPEGLRKKIEKNVSILLEHIDLPASNTVRKNLSNDRNLGLDQIGKVMGQFSTIESLNRQFIDYNKYLFKTEKKWKIDKFTEWVYDKNKELKEISRGGASAQPKVEEMMNKHMGEIERVALAKNVDPIPLLKYYHTMILSPLTGRVNKKGFVELDHSQSIHGSKLIPQSTRKDYYQRLDRFVNKLEKEYKDNTGEVRLDKAFDRTKAEMDSLRSAKKEKIAEQLSFNFKEARPDKPRKETYRMEMLALNKRDLKEVERFAELIDGNPVLRDNFNEWFGSFTQMYGDMVPRNLKDMNIKDVYAINRFFKKMGNPTDLSFHVKYFLHDPRWVDQYLVSKGIAKNVRNMMVKSPVTGKMVSVGKILSPIGSISEYSKNVKDKGTDIDTIRLKKANEKLFKYIEKLNDKDAVTKELIEWREEGGRQGTLSREAQKLDALVTDYFTHIGNNYVYVKDGQGNRYTNNRGDWALDTDFKTFFKETKGRLNKYIQYDKNGKFDSDLFYNKVIDISVDKNAGKDIIKIRREVGVDGVKRYQYEQKVERKVEETNALKLITNAKEEAKFRIEYRKKNPYKGVGFFNPIDYIPHMNFGKTELARREFVESVKKEADRKYNSVLSTTNDPKKAEKVRKAYLRQMEDVANFSTEFMTFKEIADLGEVNDSVLDKSLEGLGLKTRIGPLEGREVGLKGYDKSHKIFNDYIDKVVNGYYKTLSAIHGDKQIRDMREQLKNRKIPEAEKKYFEELYKQGDKRKSRRKGDPKAEDTIELGGREPRYKNYTDVWADYIKLHLQTVLGHQTYFPEQIMYEVNRKIDPLFLKDKRNLFYLTSDHNMMKMYEALWQKKKFKNAPFVGKILKEAPKDAEARKEYFSRKIHEFGRMEAQYELMTLLANTGTWSTNIFSGNIMTGASAGVRNLANVFNNKKVYDRLLTSNGKPVIKTLDGKFVTNRKELIKYLEERGILDNFIQHEFEYNEGMTSNLKKAGISLKNFKRDLTRAMKSEKGKRDESALEVVSRYGVKDIMLKYGSFFMRHSERFNRVNSYMAHALQAIERFGPQARELSIADPFIHEFAMKGIENTQFLYQNSFRPMFMRTATGKVLSRFKLFAWNSIRTRREFYKQAKLYGFKEGTVEYKRAKDLFLTDMFMYALGGAFMFSIFDTSLAPPYDWIQALGDWMYGDKKERDMAFFGSPLGPANLLKPPIARIPEAMGEILTGDWEQFSGYTAYTLFPFGRMARQVNQLMDDRVGRGIERAPEILFRFPYNKIQSRLERAERRSRQAEDIEELLG